MLVLNKVLAKIRKDVDIAAIIFGLIFVCAVMTILTVSMVTSNEILKSVSADKDQALQASLLREEALRGRISALEHRLSRRRAPLGVRTNNPLNLVKTPIQWQGETSCGGNRETNVHINQEVECFVSPMYGIRAAMKTMIAKRDRHRAEDLRDLIEMWATHNHEEYLAFIEKKTGFHESVLLDSLNYPLTLALLTEAMVEFEIGQESPYSFGEIYEMAKKVVGT